MLYKCNTNGLFEFIVVPRVCSDLTDSGKTVWKRRGFVIAIYDPNWFLKVLDYLKRRGLNFLIYENISSIPYYSVLYTDYRWFVEQASSRMDVAVVYDPMHNCLLLEKAILRTRFKDIYEFLTIGVDPGSTATFAVIGDDELIDHGKANPGELGDKILEKLLCIPYREAVLRVGGGVDGWRIALNLKNKLRIKVEVVDEEETSGLTKLESILIKNKFLPSRNIRLDKDLYAAIRIALRKGMIV